MTGETQSQRVRRLLTEEAARSAPPPGSNGAGAHANGHDRSHYRDWPLVTPVPADVAEPPIKPHQGETHEARHRYRDEQGGLLHIVDRFRDEKTLAKRFLPWTVRRDPRDDLESWYPCAPCAPLPFYGLERLEGANRVLLVEGELKSDRAQQLVPEDIAVISFMGGAQQPQHADYRPLKGRVIIGWPDNDDAGRKAMKDALRAAAKAGAVVRGVVRVPDGFREKWDLGDPWPETGVDPRARIAELIDAARPVDGGSGLGEWDAGEDAYDKIPPRAWLLGNQFCRGFLSSLLGAGAVGKTALRLAQYLSVAMGRSLTGEHVFCRGRVLIVSLEDDAQELRRRLLAAMIHHQIARQDICGWLFVANPRGMVLAELGEKGLQAGALEAELRRVIVDRQIDLVALDPFVKTHLLPENDNVAVDFVCRLLTKLGAEFNIAVDAPHHLRKGGAGSPGDADTGRGAGSFVDAGRLVNTLTVMSEKEAGQFGIGEGERRRYVRLDSAKVNIAPAATSAQWFKIVGVKLGNGTEEYPNGDEVQTVEPWKPTNIWGQINTVVANNILNKIDAGLPDGQRYSDHHLAKDGVAAWLVVQEFLPDVPEDQAKSVITAWLNSGVLERRKYENPVLRKQRSGLYFNRAKTPG